MHYPLLIFSDLCLHHVLLLLPSLSLEYPLSVANGYPKTVRSRFTFEDDPNPDVSMLLERLCYTAESNVHIHVSNVRKRVAIGRVRILFKEEKGRLTSKVGVVSV